MHTRAAIALGLRHPPVVGLFGMTVALALGLNLAFLSHSFLGIPGWAGYRLATERSMPEIVGYVFAAWAAGLALFLAVRHRQAVLAGWSVVFAVLLADDYFTLHEAMAKVLPTYAVLPGAYRQPVGEMLWLAIVGVVLLALVAVTYRYATPDWRAVSRVLTVLLGVLVLCGVGMDAVHAFATNGGAWNVIVTTLEDGGELVTLAIVVPFLYGLAFCEHRPTPETLTRRTPRTTMRHLRRSGTGPPTR